MLQDADEIFEAGGAVLDFAGRNQDYGPSALRHEMCIHRCLTFRVLDARDGHGGDCSQLTLARRRLGRRALLPPLPGSLRARGSEHGPVYLATERCAGACAWKAMRRLRR